jgi:hypothetical protein
MGQNIREDAWCRLLVPNKKGDAAEADSIMDDNIVDLGQYGYYRLSANPNWKPQSTLDSSGNTHVNGLYWAVPLLYTGARRGDVPMVQRYFDLIADWLSKHKKKKTRTWSVTQPIIAGERLWTLTCASDISDGARFVKATRKEANTQIDKFKLGSGTNNTGIHSQGSALAAFCYLGDSAKRDIAANNLNRLADYLVLSDGSDREGSPWYAYYTLRLLENLAPVYTRCGVPYDRIYCGHRAPPAVPGCCGGPQLPPRDDRRHPPRQAWAEVVRTGFRGPLGRDGRRRGPTTGLAVRRLLRGVRLRAQQLDRHRRPPADVLLGARLSALCDRPRAQRPRLGDIQQLRDGVRRRSRAVSL